MEFSPAIMLQVQKLDDSKKQLFWTQFSANQKKSNIGYLLWFVGCQYFYLGKPGRNILYWITFSGLGVWAIMDLFRMKKLITESNDEVAVQILTTMN